jgi:hypothetical protein
VKNIFQPPSLVGDAFRIVLIEPSLRSFLSGEDLEMIDIAW